MKASDNPFPSFLVVETAAAGIGTPGAGDQHLFIDTADHLLKYKNSGGTVSAVDSGATPSGTVKLYDYTVTGSDKASIDTNVDAPTVANFAGYDVLQVFSLLRTDDAGGTAVVDWTVNNDTGSNYDAQFDYGLGSTAAAGEALGTAAWGLTVHGSGGTAAYPSVQILRIPGYAGTVFNKVARGEVSTGDSTSSANHYAMQWALGWRNTAAITRIKVAAQSTAKLKVGSRLIVYGQ